MMEIIRPQDRPPTVIELSRLFEVGMDSVRIDARSFDEWPPGTDPQAALPSILGQPDLLVYSEPFWSLDFPADLIGTIYYEGGSTGRIAVTQHRVGFEDAHNDIWYFQWDARVPDWSGE